MKSETDLGLEILEYSKERRARMLLFSKCSDFIEEHVAEFIQLGVRPSGYDHYVDLDGLSREQVVIALKLFPGKYTKRKNDATMHYEHDLGNGLILRFYNAALPPGCKLVEKTEVVPAQPATTKKVFEIQCGGAGQIDDG